MMHFLSNTKLKQCAGCLATAVFAVLLSGGLLQFAQSARLSLVHSYRNISASISGRGMIVTYFADTELQDSVAQRFERALLRNYNTLPPPSKVPADRFSARWVGWLECPESAEYRFYGQANGGFRMFINDLPVLNNWEQNKWYSSGTHGNATLSAGAHKIVVEFFTEKPAAAIRIRWMGGGIPANTILSSPYLYIEYPTLK